MKRIHQPRVSTHPLNDIYLLNHLKIKRDWEEVKEK